MAKQYVFATHSRKQVRALFGMSQSEFAEVLGLSKGSQGNISKYERGLIDSPSLEKRYQEAYEAYLKAERKALRKEYNQYVKMVKQAVNNLMAATPDYYLSPAVQEYEELEAQGFSIQGKTNAEIQSDIGELKRILSDDTLTSEGLSDYLGRLGGNTGEGGGNGAGDHFVPPDEYSVLWAVYRTVKNDTDSYEKLKGLYESEEIIEAIEVAIEELKYEGYIITFTLVLEYLKGSESFKIYWDDVEDDDYGTPW